VAQQSLYRRYRPRRFSEVRGQDHVVTALLNAVRSGTEGHAYLFSGPRGTGKTSTARILAKALNCENLDEGEPCCECESCREMESGRSFDLFELDAASNSGVDAIRDLTEKAAVGSPGRTKVYILDEVHMLSTAASNALLKTLEEPPGHVCFVLATTDPQKVLPTIRSRTQRYEFQLLSADELTDYVRWIAQDATLDLDEKSIAHVVRQGRGSARDTLSALDQVVAAGGVISRDTPVDDVMRALSDGDGGGAVRSVSDAIALGHDPRVLAEALLVELRDAFLISLGVEVTHLVDTDLDRIGDWARALGTPTLTRSMEAVGTALVDMRNAADPRVPLEVALVRLCSSPSGTSGAGSTEAGRSDASGSGSGHAAAVARAGDEGVLAELARRIEVLEQALAASRPADPPPDGSPSEDSAGGAGDGPARARAALGAKRKADGGATSERRSAPTVPTRPSAPRRPDAPPAAPRPPTAAPAARSSEEAPVAVSPTAIDRDALTLAFGDVVVPSLKGVAKAVYGSGRFVSVGDDGAVLALENAPTRDRAEKFRPDVEAALTAHFGAPVRLVLVDGSDPLATAGPASSGSEEPARPVPAPDSVRSDTDSDTDTDDDESTIVDVHELEDADVAATGVDKLTKAFPGAVLVDGAEGTS